MSTIKKGDRVAYTEKGSTGPFVTNGVGTVSAVNKRCGVLSYIVTIAPKRAVLVVPGEVPEDSIRLLTILNK